MGRQSKRKPQLFKGVAYYWKPPGYYKSDDGAYMHRVVWEDACGPIPSGHHIHHRDGDRGNNDKSNLECLPAADHAAHHGRERLPRGSDKAKAHMERIRPAASRWHASDAGRAWHSEHGKASWQSRPTERLQCVFCDKPFERLVGAAKRGFCSASCQGMARRKSGVDDVERKCFICGAAFRVNKYVKTATCGKACWKVAIGRTRKGL